MDSQKNVRVKRCAKLTPRKGGSAKKLIMDESSAASRQEPTSTGVVNRPMKSVELKNPILNSIKLFNSCVQRMTKTCVAAGCSMTPAQVSVYQFPKDAKIASKWKKHVNEKRWGFFPSKNSALCALHFKDEDFENLQFFKMGFSQRLLLKSNACPSVHRMNVKEERILFLTKPGYVNTEIDATESNVEAVKGSDYSVGSASSRSSSAKLTSQREGGVKRPHSPDPYSKPYSKPKKPRSRNALQKLTFARIFGRTSEVKRRQSGDQRQTTTPTRKLDVTDVTCQVQKHNLGPLPVSQPTHEAQGETTEQLTSKDNAVKFNEKEYYQCPSCCKSFTSVFYLFKHFKNHEKCADTRIKVEDTSDDDVTQKETQTLCIAEQLASKDNAVRFKAEPYQCATCCKSFISMSYLRKHMKNHEKCADTKIKVEDTSDDNVAQKETQTSISTLTSQNYTQSACKDEEDIKIEDEESADNNNNNFHKQARPSQGSNHLQDKAKTAELENTLPRGSNIDFVMALHKCEICQVKCWSKETLMLHMDSHSATINDDSARKTNSSNSAAHSANSIPMLSNIQKIANLGLFISSSGEPYLAKIPHCSLCRKDFDQQTSLDKHVIDSHIKCMVCSLAFSDQNSLYTHMKSHPHCSVCNAYFMKELDLESHEKTHHVCNMCKQSFINQEDLNKHIIDVHFKCPVCGLIFLDKNAGNAHLKVHRGSALKISNRKPSIIQRKKVYLSCIWCKVEFDNETHLQLHNEQIHQKCVMCNQWFNNETDLDLHKVASHKKCVFCNKWFNNETDIEKHNLAIHIQCAICTQWLKNLKVLKKHYVHQKCDFCNQWSKNGTDLESHNMARPQKCTACRQWFMNQYNLDIHIAKDHLKCCECQVVCHNETQLFDKNAGNAHLKVHKGSAVKISTRKPSIIQCKKIYPSCIWCKVEFNNVTHLQLHNKQIHQKCAICKRWLKNETDLDSHKVAMHQKCVFCNKWFNNETDKEKHNLAIHIKCAICTQWFKNKTGLENHNVRVHQKCVLCKEWLNNETILDLHNEAMHQKCDFCNQWFKNETDKEKHNMAFHEKCVFCKQWFINEIDLESHNMATHQTCAVCKQCFMNQYNLDIHIAKDHVKCCVCQVVCHDETQLFAHFKTHPTCTICKKTFLDAVARTEHQKIHPQCAFCQKDFCNLADVELHIQTHPQCSVCAQRFISQRAIELHVDEDHFKCLVCDLIFVDKNLLFAHMKTHPKCDKCVIVLLNAVAHNLNKTIHPQCHLCNIFVEKQEGLKSHYKECHSMSCPSCKRMFFN